MTKYRWKHTKILLPYLFLLGYFNTAFASDTAVPEEIQQFDAGHYGLDAVQWKKGQYLNLCNTTGKCQSVKMPKALGKIERVIEGPLISSARSSWLALSKFDTYVCTALRSRTTVACAKVDGVEPPPAGVGVALGISTANKTRLFLKANKAGIDAGELARLNASFVKAVARAAYILQGEVDQEAAGMSGFTSSLSICDKDPRYPGPPPSPDCELVEEGNAFIWSCPVVGTPPPRDPPPMPEPIDPPECL